MRQIFGEIRWEIKALIFAGLVIAFSLFGPFGTYDSFAFAERFAYWTGVMFFVAFFIHIAVHLALTQPWLAATRPVLRVLIGAVIGALPAAAMVMFIDRTFRDTDIDMEGLVTIWLQISLIAGFIAPFEYLDLRSSGATPSTIRTRFHDRLSPDLGNDIISLSMQDHYVEVTTTKGSELVLLRLRDAMTELRGLEGLQTHRSHWAARRHLRALERKGARQIVHLSDGRHLPVSATYADAVEAAALGNQEKTETTAKD